MNAACLVLWASLATQPGTAAPLDGASPASSAPAPSTDSILLLPMSAQAGQGEAVANTVQTVERGLFRGLVRQNTARVLRLSDVQDQLGQAAAQQMTGCDEESCLAALADSLGADRLVKAVLTHNGTTLVLRISVMERRTATVILRREVHARSVDALLGSLETVCREVTGGTRLVTADPALAGRLGTDDAGAAALRAAMEPGGDPMQTWTDVVVSHNRESDALALMEGGLVLAAGMVVVLGAPVVGSVALLGGLAMRANGPASLAFPNPGAGGRYVYPWLQLGAQVALSIMMLMFLPPMAAAVVLLAVDRLNVGRIKVARDGCCRNERDIRAATRPSPIKRVAPILAVAGAAMLALSPMFLALGAVPLAAVAGVATLAGRPFPETPGITGDEKQFAAIYALSVVPGVVLYPGFYVLAAAGAAVAVALVLDERVPLVDDE